MNPYNPKPIEQPSIFHDRHDGHFQTWMRLEGLQPDASDELVMDAMVKYFDTHQTDRIYPHVSQTAPQNPQQLISG